MFDCAFVNPTNSNFRSIIEARNILKGGLELIRGREEKLPVPDQENSSGQNGERENDEYSQPDSAGHLLLTFPEKSRDKRIVALSEFIESAFDHNVSFMNERHAI